MIENIFTNKEIIDKIQKKLPKLFHVAELECSRGGKVGMEVGSLRERILVSLLISLYGSDNIVSEIPITEKETDVIVYNNPISIKTSTGKNSVFKLVWTTDSEKTLEFYNKYEPEHDILLVKILWDKIGAVYYIKKETQKEVLYEIGRNNYIKLPKGGVDTRGVEISKEALGKLLIHKDTLIIPIEWKKEQVEFDAFERWTELWEKI